MSAFEPWLSRWGLIPDGEAIVTFGSRLLPVRHGAQAAMLKLPQNEEERQGMGLLRWWDGLGAARVLAQSPEALLMERASDPDHLTRLVLAGEDSQASRILCGVAAQLHMPRTALRPVLFELEPWFRALAPAARQYGGVLVDAQRVAATLLADPQDVRPLHGDLHHGNVLDFGPEHESEGGWRAIDPKGLLGERGYDFANIFCNPNPADIARSIATAPGRLAAQAQVVAQAAGLEHRRLLSWILAYGGLSAAWSLQDPGDHPPDVALEVARIALAELRR